MLNSLNEYRTKVKSLEEVKQKVNDDFNKAQLAFSETVFKLDNDLKTIHTGLDTLVVSEAEKLFEMPSREKALFKGLYMRDPKVAVDWLKTKFGISKVASYPSTVKRVKKAFGYSEKEGREYHDFLITKHESFKKTIRELYLTTVAKKPRTNAEHFGVEIECFVPAQRDVREQFQAYCIEQRIKGAQIKSDGSISPDSDYTGIEITVVIPRDNIRDLEKVCEWLKLKKARVNQSCGLHVHLDFRHRTNLQQAATRLYNALPYISRLVPETRRTNRYCRLEKNSIEGDGDRYAAINLQAFNKFKTLEVRLHSGTCNFSKITSWCMILSNIMDNEKFSKAQSDTSIDKFIELLEFKSDDLNYYIYERYKKFNGDKAIKEEKGEE
jgi:hypothetical protein